MSAAAAHVGAAGTLVLAPQQASTSGSIAPAVSITGEQARSQNTTGSAVRFERLSQQPLCNSCWQYVCVQRTRAWQQQLQQCC
jgi:hypothetical protein